MENSNRRISFRTKLTASAFFVLACAAVFGIGFGLGNGGLGSGGAVAGTAATVQNPPALITASALPSASAESQFTITINERDIVYKGTHYSLDELKQTLLRKYTGEETFVLRDDRAIKSVYDSVKSLLDGMNIEYIEK